MNLCSPTAAQQNLKEVAKESGLMLVSGVLQAERLFVKELRTHRPKALRRITFGGYGSGGRKNATCLNRCLWSLSRAGVGEVRIECFFGITVFRTGIFK